MNRGQEGTGGGRCKVKGGGGGGGWSSNKVGIGKNKEEFKQY